MEFVINNKKKAKLIGLKGYETGLKYFNTLAYKEELKRFMLDVLKIY